MLARLHERDRDTLAARAPRSTDAMHVRFRCGRHVVVHDVRHLLDVEPARRDVGGDEQIRRAAPHAPHHAVALLLRHPAVERLRSIAATIQRLRQLVHLGSRPTEHERQRRHLDVENAPERRDLVRARDDVPHLPHARHRAFAGAFRGNRDANGILEVTLRHGADARRQRSGEQRGLPGLWCFREDRLQILGETHVQHLVRLVEHDGADAA